MLPDRRYRNDSTFAVSTRGCRHGTAVRRPPLGVPWGRAAGGTGRGGGPDRRRGGLPQSIGSSCHPRGALLSAARQRDYSSSLSHSRVRCGGTGRCRRPGGSRAEGRRSRCRGTSPTAAAVDSLKVSTCRLSRWCQSPTESVLLPPHHSRRPCHGVSGPRRGRRPSEGGTGIPRRRIRWGWWLRDSDRSGRGGVRRPHRSVPVRRSGHEISARTKRLTTRMRPPISVPAGSSNLTSSMRSTDIAD
jgi:hypothetical protein